MEKGTIRLFHTHKYDKFQTQLVVVPWLLTVQLRSQAFIERYNSVHKPL